MATKQMRSEVKRLAELVIEHADQRAAMFGGGWRDPETFERYYNEPLQTAADVDSIAAAMGTEAKRSHADGWTTTEVEAFGVCFFHMEKRV